MILVSVFTGLLPFVLLLQHPMCPMSVLLLLYIPLLQCRCSTVVCYWSTAHMFCACLFKKCTVEGTIRPRLRAPSFKVIAIVAMVLRNLVLLNCGIWLVAMETKCTVKGTSCVWENALWKVRIKPSQLAGSLSSAACNRGNGTSSG